MGDDGFAGAADGGVDDDDEDGVGGEVGRGAGEEASAFGDVVGRDLVGDVDDADAGVDGFHDGFADADGVVFDVEVGHEADDVLGLLGGECGGDEKDGWEKASELHATRITDAHCSGFSIWQVIDGLFAAAFAEEVGEERAALFGEEAGDDFELVVELGVVHDGED